MKLYLDNLIPRLKEFSLNLDKQEVFLEKQWVIIDSESNKQTYIFRRNGELIMSINGQVTIGKWEYINEARSLLVDRIQDKILLNQIFISHAIMILRKDGFKEDHFILANENLIPNLNIIEYLNFLINHNILEKGNSKNNYKEETRELISKCYKTNKGKIIIKQQESFGTSIGDLVFKDNLTAPDGVYRLGFMDNITTENGIIIGI